MTYVKAVAYICKQPPHLKQSKIFYGIPFFMAKITIQVNNDVGLHARPAAVFVETAQKYQSEIKIYHGLQETNGKSLLGVLGLGVKKGDELTVEFCGSDSDEALRAIQEIAENNFSDN